MAKPRTSATAVSPISAVVFDEGPCARPVRACGGCSHRLVAPVLITKAQGVCPGRSPRRRPEADVGSPAVAQACKHPTDKDLACTLSPLHPTCANATDRRRTSAIELDDLVRVFGRGDGRGARARRRHAVARARHVHRRDGAVGLRQVDAAAARGRARPPDLGPRAPRRASSSASSASGARPAAARADRIRLPVLQPARRRSPRSRTSRCPRGSPAGGCRAPSVRGGARRASASPTAPGHRPGAALRRPAAARRDRPGAGRRARASSSPTSRRARSTRAPGRGVLALLRERSTRAAGRS